MNLRRYANLVITISSIYVTLAALGKGFEGEFSIRTVMEHPSSTPMVGHRLLFVGIAWLFKLAFPALVFRQAYFCSQLIALVFAFTAMTLWVRRIVGSESIGTGAALTALCLIPTFAYFTFYDIAIVGFYATCLLLLVEHRYGLYLLVFGLGLTNHENLLLLLPVAALWLWDQRQKHSAVWMCFGHLGIYAAYRLAVMHWLPNDTVFHNRIWQNSHPFTYYSLNPLYRYYLVFAAAALFLPFAGTIIGLRIVPRMLKIATIALFPGLFLVTFLFGQFHEPRQFVAFVPVAVPMILYAINPRSGTNPIPELRRNDLPPKN